MTVTTPGSDLEPWGGEDFAGLGMEDIGAGELTIPRIEIMHADGRFRDRNSKVEYPVLRAAILGVVKGRIYWAKEVDDGDKPLCRSNNFEIGFPQLRTDIPKDKQFPWEKSNFNPSDFPPGDDGLVRLPCATCRFKEWDVNGQKKPLCSELYMLPLVYESDEDGTMSPGILTVKSSAVKNLKAYITPFKSAGRPMFTSMTEIGLALSSRGSVKFSVPSFKKLGTTERSEWAGYADQYRSIRDFLQRDPRPQDDKDASPTKPMASSTAATRLEEDDPWASAAPPPPPPGRAAPSVPASDLPF